jgi:hypothetical protein
MQFDRLRRRDFIALLGGSVTWPVAVRAQLPSRLPTIGLLGAGTAAAQALGLTVAPLLLARADEVIE